MKSCLAELGVELIKFIDAAGGFITWGGRNLDKLSRWLDGHVVSFSIPFVVSKISI